MRVMVHLSVVLFVVHDNGIAIIKLKSKAPGARHINRVAPLHFAFQGVQAITGQVHILRRGGGIQTIEAGFQLAGMPGVETLVVPS